MLVFSFRKISITTPTMQSSDASRKTVLITGAGSGFGRALAHAFHAEGWQILPLVRNAAQVAELSSVFSIRCFPVFADVATNTVGEQIAPAIKASGGILSLLINNAGVPGSGSEIERVDLAQTCGLLDTHCVGALRCAKACIPYLRSSAGGWIVNISSRLGSLARNAHGDFVEEEHSYAYRIAKAALNMATICLSQDKSLSGIGVASVHPGRMQTALGGVGAPHLPSESALLLLRQLQSGKFKSGRFYDLYGDEILW
jgi:NAD(P)-dependent dehydrogenase (short-subunit alcohol dehydrogenase family)